MAIDPIYTSPERLAAFEAHNAKRRWAQARYVAGGFTPEQIHEAAARRMAEYDALPREWRECVNEHGMVHTRRLMKDNELLL